MLRSSTLLEHGPRLPVQRQWNTWLLAVVALAVLVSVVLAVLAVVVQVDSVLGQGSALLLALIIPLQLERVVLDLLLAARDQMVPIQYLAPLLLPAVARAEVPHQS